MSQQNKSQNSDKKIYVGGIPWETSEEGLRNFFQQFGEITHANVVCDRATGQSKGFGFVTFKDAESATRACANENPTIDGRVATCRLRGDNVNQNQSNQTRLRHDDLCYLAPSFWLNQQQPSNMHQPLTPYVEPYWNQYYSQWQYHHPQYNLQSPYGPPYYPQYGPQFYPVVDTNQPYWPQQPINTDRKT